MTHKGRSYPGEHTGIIEPALFAKVAAMMEQHRVDHDWGTNSTDPSLLAGIIWDGEGRRMSPNHATKNSRRYRYYVSRIDPAAPPSVASRVPAGDLEAVVTTRLRALLAAALNAEPDDESIQRATILDALATGAPNKQRAALLACISRITIFEESVRLELSATAVALPEVSTIEARLVRRGKEVRLALAPDAGGDRLQDASLIKLITKANAARVALDRCEHKTLAELAAEQGYTRDYFTVLLRLSYLAPDITAAILDGRQPVQLNRQRLARAANLPVDWQAQREMLGFA
ncbi:hypothetical protein SPAN111604_08470 [Sphingomonas antarctica]|uniref:hypothetical protein n=1 Tax=Sphingomonas antarctica TaxID=2040274 RepID=UPI0039EBB92C